MSKLSSPRTKLRRLRLEDLEAMIELESDPDIVKFTPFVIPQSREETETRLRAQIAKTEEHEPLGIWAAVTKSDESFIGWFMLVKTQFEGPEIGFMLRKKFWGQGLATEISKAILDFAFKDVQIKSAFATCNQENFASIRILEKLGFQFFKIVPTKNRVTGQAFEINSYKLTTLG